MRDSSPDHAERKRRRTLLLGVGLDNEDEHIRVTRGPNFHLVGGSEETHGRMQQTAIRLNEKLKKRGRELGEVSREEFRDLLRESME